MFLFSAFKKTQRLASRLSQMCVLIGLILGAAPAFSESRNATIEKTSITQYDNQSVIINFTFDKPVKYKVFTLTSPDRVVIDLDKTTDSLKLTEKNPSFLKKLRYAKRNTDDLRIVLDLQQSVKAKATLRGKQLQIALQTNSVKKPRAMVSPNKPLKNIIKDKTQQKVQPIRPSSPVPATPARPRTGDFIVAIDAGHGGRDPGALGANGTMEKTVVLQMAKRLKKRLDQAHGMRGVLIRDSDHYVPLRKRMEIARYHKADLFISIHADANPDRRLTGSSVFILSQNGASSEAARWLASNENSYESKLAGTSLKDKDNTLASMLMDLSQAATIDSSLTLAENTLSELGQVTRLLHKEVESAAFVVLKSPDIPSILVETAFISNPSEELRLRTSQYQNKLTTAIFNGIKNFKVAHAPGGKLKIYASNSTNLKHSPHIVRRGESLSVIAKKYGINQSLLSDHNQLNSNTLLVGQKLYIPTRS